MKYLFTTLITCCFYFTLSAQLIEQKSHNKYIIDGETYKKKEIAFAFDKNSEANNIYQRALNQSNTSRTILFTSLGIFVAGNGLLIFGSSSNYIISPTQVIGAVTGYVLAPIVAIVAIPIGLSARVKLKKAVDLHNHQYIELNGYQKDQSHLDFGVSTNGIGLQYTF